MKRAFTLALVLIMTFGMTSCGNPNAEKVDWVNISLGEVLPEPQSGMMEILNNSDEWLNVYIHDMTENDYQEYVRWCEDDKGFAIDTENYGSSFNSYNGDGYYLSLYYNNTEETMHISLNAPIPMGEYVLPDFAAAAGLPLPESKMGSYNWENEDGFFLYVGGTDVDAYKEYKSACVSAGFTEDTCEGELFYSGSNTAGYYLSIGYEGFDTIKIELRCPDDEESADDSISSDGLIPLPCSDSDYLWTDYQDIVDDFVEAGFTNVNAVPLEDMTEDDWLVSEGEYDEIAVDGSASFSDGDLHPADVEIIVTYHSYEESAGSVSADEPSDEPGEDPSESPKITVTMDEDEFLGMNYTEAEALLKDMGFTVFEYQVLKTDDQSKPDDTIGAVEIKNWAFGKGDFVTGDTYDADAIVVLWYYEYTEPEKPSPVFYSTNDYETATEGNTGVFSYRSKGGSYDIYWIIDFDEGYAYYFTDGDGESFCDRLEIESGDLNSNITITYHDDGTEWSYKLHFKYVNHPETLIMVDQNGFDYDYSTTDLDDALSIRSTKTIKDY